MKVLLIDTAYTEYSREFAKSCRKYVDTTVIRKYYTEDTAAIPMFYKFSEKMKQGKLRKIIRCFEYFYGYFRILNYVKKNRFDVVHIQWPQILSFDKYVFKKLKKQCGKLVYTAHDVIPHEPTQNQIRAFGKLYRIPDTIIVHGNFCKDEFYRYYPESANKVFVQKHGIARALNKELDLETTKKYQFLNNIITDNKIVFSFIGQISPYKGLDLLLEAWEKFCENEKVFLLVIGRTTCDYNKLHDCFEKVKHYKNVYVYNERYTDSEEVFFYSLSDVIVMPYKSASMSGVFASAARYKKTILTTTVGCLEEYTNPVRNKIFTCDSDVESISSNISNIAEHYSKEKLRSFGLDFSNEIQNLYDWDTILKDVVKNCYFG